MAVSCAFLKPKTNSRNHDLSGKAHMSNIRRRARMLCISKDLSKSHPGNECSHGEGRVDRRVHGNSQCSLRCRSPPKGRDIALLECKPPTAANRYVNACVQCCGRQDKQFKKDLKNQWFVGA